MTEGSREGQKWKSGDTQLEVKCKNGTGKKKRVRLDLSRQIHPIHTAGQQCF